ncbi:plastocyanin/azurin family copper-binding protein [Halorubrum salsamenti]|uniref:plastocyanin/azurin family copper-binding protein n=1 Tax=Halorubrum salsamenti TaxID=2583990 RepID=UPI001F4F8DA7|nr:plastocyanin/azurin family copper-binding protein [Halorubrum salsamenti]
MDGGNFFIDPVGLYVEPGETVTFEIGPGAPHSSTAYEDRIPSDAEPWDSGLLQEGETFEHTFEVEGTYDYNCTAHVSLGQVGRIVVGSPGGPATESSIPTNPPSGQMPDSQTIVDQGSIAYPFTGTASGGSGESGSGQPAPQVPDSAKTLGILAFAAMVSTLGLTYVFMKYGGDYGVE